MKAKVGQVWGDRRVIVGVISQEDSDDYILYVDKELELHGSCGFNHLNRTMGLSGEVNKEELEYFKGIFREQSQKHMMSHLAQIFSVVDYKEHEKEQIIQGAHNLIKLID